MSEQVFRLALVRGGVLSGPFTGSIATRWWRDPSDTAWCGVSPHRAPARQCQCGIWASPDPAALAQFVADWREFDNWRVLSLAAGGFASTTRAHRATAIDGMISNPGDSFGHLKEMSPEALFHVARDMHWENIAVVRADAHGPGMGMFNVEAGRWQGNHEYLARLRESRGLSDGEAVELSARLNHPAGFARYGSVTITGVWLDAGWVEIHGQDLTDRYRCPVWPVEPEPRADWITGFERSATLPGMEPCETVDRYRDRARRRELDAARDLWLEHVASRSRVRR